MRRVRIEQYMHHIDNLHWAGRFLFVRFCFGSMDAGRWPAMMRIYVPNKHQTVIFFSCLCSITNLFDEKQFIGLKGGIFPVLITRSPHAIRDQYK